MSELQVNIRLDWSGPGHYDPEQSLPCGECHQPTVMRDSQGQPCHLSCAERALAAEVLGISRIRMADERFDYSERDLAAELLGRADDNALTVTGERVPTPAQTLARPDGGAR
jgi:hypothetical protein